MTRYPSHSFRSGIVRRPSSPLETTIVQCATSGDANCPVVRRGKELATSLTLLPANSGTPRHPLCLFPKFSSAVGRLYPAGKGSTPIRCSMALNSLRVKWLSLSATTGLLVNLAGVPCVCGNRLAGLGAPEFSSFRYGDP